MKLKIMIEEKLMLDPKKNQTKYQSILVFGPPGSGKGTLCQFLTAHDNIFHLSTGDIFRSMSKESPAGKLANSYLEQGLLVPDEVTIEIWQYYVSGLIASNQFFPEKQVLLLDGIPRTYPQAEMIDQHINLSAIIALQIPDQKRLIKRLQERAKKQKRADDAKTEVLERRMQIYESETKRVLEYYPKEKIHHFNADQKRLQLLGDVLGKLAEELSQFE